MRAMPMTPVVSSSHTLVQLAGRGLCATLLLLLLPVAAMCLSPQVQWGPADFAAAGSLLFGTIFGVLLARRLCSPGRWRHLAVCFLVGSALLIWTELAVGIFW